MISQKQLPRARQRTAADSTTACINIHFNISVMLIRNIDGLILRGRQQAAATADEVVDRRGTLNAKSLA